MIYGPIIPMIKLYEMDHIGNEEKKIHGFYSYFWSAGLALQQTFHGTFSIIRVGIGQCCYLGHCKSIAEILALVWGGGGGGISHPTLKSGLNQYKEC